MSPEIQKLNEILLAIQESNQLTILQNSKVDTQLIKIEAMNQNLLMMLDKQNDQIFIFHSLTIGIAFLLGFLMWYLLKKNFYNFGV